MTTWKTDLISTLSTIKIHLYLIFKKNDVMVKWIIINSPVGENTPKNIMRRSRKNNSSNPEHFEKIFHRKPTKKKKKKKKKKNKQKKKNKKNKKNKIK